MSDHDDKHDDLLAKVIWDAASRESSLDLPPWESLSGDRRVAHDVARAVREYLRDQSACDEEIVKTAPTTSPAQRRHDELITVLRELGNLLDDRLPEPPQPGAQVGIPTSNPVKVTVSQPLRTPEPAVVTEEPPVGSQVTDRDGEVWGRFEEGWQVWDALDYMEWSGVSDQWSTVRKCAPLRLTTDADRERVGLPVDTAPDVDPDEVKRLRERTEEAEAAMREEVAEHDKTRATVLRLTRERDEARDALGILVKRQTDDQSKIERLTYLLGSHADGSQCTCTEINPGAEGISPPEWEQDPWCPTHPDMNVILTEVKRLRDGIDVIRSDARRSAHIAAVPGERRILRAIHLYLSGLLEPKPPTDFSTLFNQTEGETDDRR